MGRRRFRFPNQRRHCADVLIEDLRDDDLPRISPSGFAAVCTLK
jgi:hypothetical protein